MLTHTVSELFEVNYNVCPSRRNQPARGSPTITFIQTPLNSTLPLSEPLYHHLCEWMFISKVTNAKITKILFDCN